MQGFFGGGAKAILTAAVLAAGLPATTAHAEDVDPPQQFLAMGTSTPGGSFFPLGGAMASVIAERYPQLQISVEATGGSTDNINLMGNGQVELALTTNDLAYFAWNGEEPYDREIRNFGGLMAGHATLFQLYTLGGTGIESIEDLQGKRVSLGAPGSVGNSIGQIVIEAHGLMMGEDWTPEYLGHGDGPGALRDGRVDAVLIISSVPVGVVTDITSTEGSNVVFLTPDEDVLAELLEEHPYWLPATIAGGVYSGHDEDIPGTFAVKTVLLASDDVDEDAAYAIVQSLVEGQEAFARAHALGRDWTLDNAVEGIEGVFPFHPGAERYFREQGRL